VARLLLKSFQSPGVIVMMSAAVRDLHKAHPGQFVTDGRVLRRLLEESGIENRFVLTDPHRHDHQGAVSGLGPIATLSRSCVWTMNFASQSQANWRTAWRPPR